jgi:hypothetical protein
VPETEPIVSLLASGKAGLGVPGDGGMGCREGFAF